MVVYLGGLGAFSCACCLKTAYRKQAVDFRLDGSAVPVFSDQLLRCPDYRVVLSSGAAGVSKSVARARHLLL